MPPKTLTKPSPKKSARTASIVARRSAVVRKKQRANVAQDIPRLVVRPDGKILYASPSMAKTLGLKESDFGQKSLRDTIDFTAPEDALRDRPCFGFNIAEEKEDGDVWTSSITSGDHEIKCLIGKKLKPIMLRFDRITMGDGRDFLVASSPKADDSANEDLAHFLSTLTTEKTKEKPEPAPQVLPPSSGDVWQRFLPAFVEMGNDFMFLLSPRGKIEQANAGFYNTLGGDQDLYNGKPFLDLIHPDDRASIQPLFKNLIQEGAGNTIKAIAFECRVLGKSNKQHWLDCRLKTHENRLMVVARDLTSSKYNEQELLRREQQLSEAQSIGHMGHWTWRMGEENLEFSPEIYRIFGVKPEQFIPTIDSVNSVMHRRDRGRMAQAFQRAMIDRKNYVMEFRIIRPDGEERYIELQGRCEKDSEGDVTALFGIMQDITDRTKHECELQNAVEEAKRAYAAKSQFLANMSHELRTPLNAIIGFSEMIGRQMLGPIGTEKYLEYIGGIRESGEHLLDLITDILDMSKIEAGKYTLDIEEFNL
ncbi:MAG: PAS domain-containing protein [Pseudomonadota bacterium]